MLPKGRITKGQKYFNSYAETIFMFLYGFPSTYYLVFQPMTIKLLGIQHYLSRAVIALVEILFSEGRNFRHAPESRKEIKWSRL